MARVRKPFVFALVILLVADVAAGRGFTWLMDRQIANWRRAEAVVRVESHTLHHELAPRQSVDAKWGPSRYTLVTNSLGFRDATIRHVPLAGSGRRVLFIGDSFTEGIGVDYDVTFVGRVGAALAARNIEVLNAGTWSWSPVTYRRKIEQLVAAGFKFDSLVVFLDISDIQDSVDFVESPSDGGLRLVTTPPEKSFGARMGDVLVRSSIVARLTATGFEAVAGPTPAQASVAYMSDRSGWPSDARLFDQYGRRGLAAAEEQMTALLAIARARSIDMTLAVYPWPRQIAERDLDSRHVSYWKAWSERYSVAFVNLFPNFIDARDPMDVIGRYFIPGDVHWNADGHALVASHFLSVWRPPS